MGSSDGCRWLCRAGLSASDGNAPEHSQHCLPDAHSLHRQVLALRLGMISKQSKQHNNSHTLTQSSECSEQQAAGRGNQPCACDYDMLQLHMQAFI